MLQKTFLCLLLLFNSSCISSKVITSDPYSDIQVIYENEKKYKKIGIEIQDIDNLFYKDGNFQYKIGSYSVSISDKKTFKSYDNDLKQGFINDLLIYGASLGLFAYYKKDFSSVKELTLYSSLFIGIDLIIGLLVSFINSSMNTEIIQNDKIIDYPNTFIPYKNESFLLKLGENSNILKTDYLGIVGRYPILSNSISYKDGFINYNNSEFANNASLSIKNNSYNILSTNLSKVISTENNYIIINKIIESHKIIELIESKYNSGYYNEVINLSKSINADYLTNSESESLIKKIQISYDKQYQSSYNNQSFISDKEIGEILLLSAIESYVESKNEASNESKLSILIRLNQGIDAYQMIQSALFDNNYDQAKEYIIKSTIESGLKKIFGVKGFWGKFASKASASIVAKCLK